MESNRNEMFDLMMSNANSGLPGLNQSPSPVSTQQRRQNTMGNYATNNTYKRMFNPLQTPIGMQRINNGVSGGTGQEYYYEGGENNSGSAPAPPQTTVRMQKLNGGNVNQYGSTNYQNNFIRNRIMQNSINTPTPSGSELPSSPNAVQPTNVSPQDYSDLSDSNLILMIPGVHTPQELGKGNLQTTFLENPNIPQKQQQGTPFHNPNSQLEDTEEQQGHSQPHQQQQQQQQQQQLARLRPVSEEEQQLASKLKETYKNIVNFEEIVQKNCMEVTLKIGQVTSAATSVANSTNVSFFPNSRFSNNQMSSSVLPNNQFNITQARSSELLNDLWTVYHHNVILLDNYHDFLVTALKPSSNQTQFKTGRNIVDLYKIPRRMWVYGIVGFLEVLKNVMNIFQEHDICLCFIAHCFNIISNLTDTNLEMEGWWLEKLGDLSRMAIALYPSKFIDWKSSAEYWYCLAMKTLYGHGKIYYHASTVHQDNLDALVNIGKSVVCRDPFVPTDHYLKLVVENICTQRNILSLLELPTIDFIKIHKVLLSIHSTTASDTKGNSIESIQDTQLQYGIDLVTRYGITFGSDSNGYNFFTRELYTTNGVTSSNDPHNPYYAQQQGTMAHSLEKINFWSNKGPLFAIANINHLIGFGDPKNPFAKVFGLPEVLRGRKDKKDKKSKSSLTGLPEQSGDIVNGLESESALSSELTERDWFSYLQYVNSSVFELSMRIFQHYLIGPKQASMGHVLIWLYFLVALGRAMEKTPSSRTMFMWLVRTLFPWEYIINYLNSTLDTVRSSNRLSFIYSDYYYSQPETPGSLNHFQDNEFLSEVWKCWGTLWYDFISLKEDYIDPESAGVIDDNIFDLPSSGTTSNSPSASAREGRAKGQQDPYNDERVVRLLIVATHLADNFDFGLVRDTMYFRFDERAYRSTHDFLTPFEKPEIYRELENFFLNDVRFTQNGFLKPLTSGNLISELELQELSMYDKDAQWFSNQRSFSDNSMKDFEHYLIHDEMDGYGDPEYDEQAGNKDQTYHAKYHQQKHNKALQQASFSLEDQENFIDESDPTIRKSFEDKLELEGNLGPKMDTNVTYITLDTIIWLKHCGRIFKCVRDQVFKVLMPIIVFQELRSLRKSAEATISDAATRSVIIIRELYLSNDILPLRFDGAVASDINEIKEFENNSNWKSNVDETILRSVSQHDAIGKRYAKGLNMTITPILEDDSDISEDVTLSAKAAKVFNYCILITDDRNIRLKADSIGLASFQSKWFFSQLEFIFPHRSID